jgi:YbbR domain-containing protein
MKNLFLFLFSCFLGTLLWVGFVSSTQNIREYNEDISIKYFNTPSSLSVITEPILIRVKIDSQVLQKDISKDTFEAYADLSQASEGKFIAPLQVQSNNPKVRVVSYSPQTVEIQLEPKEEKEFSLSIETEGSVHENFTVSQTKPLVTKVKLHAGKSLLEKVSYVKGKVFLQGETKNSRSTAKIFAYDAEGKNLSHITLIPETVEVDLTLTETLFEKTVGIKVPLEGTLPEGFFIESFTYSPQTIEIKGKKQIVDSFSFIQTESVDLSLLSPYNTLQKKIIPPLYTETLKIDRVTIDITLQKLDIPHKPSIE